MVQHSTPEYADERTARIALSVLAPLTSRDLSVSVAARGATQILAAMLSRLDADTAAALSGQVRRAIDTAGRIQARVLMPGDDEWPGTIAALNTDEAATFGRTGAPLCLWVQGAQHLAKQLSRSMTVTGTAAASADGQHIAAGLAEDLAAAGWTVAARSTSGIDRAALLGAARHTDAASCVMVAACGLDLAHQHPNDPTIGWISRNGLLVSPFPPGHAATLFSRMHSQGVLASTTGATLIVEAPVGSRAVRAARLAAALGRPAMATPGPASAATWAGGHALIRDHGAHLVSSATDAQTAYATTPT
ncbi:DNA-processing protein DprA [Dactylosporangium sp. NPDC050688]|uniref:DNA-processing protein DprA n=1 Tax=Dactylosporangium sp. NPDC050688 TaxID=3157217 RepID=UPI0033CC69D0